MSGGRADPESRHAEARLDAWLWHARVLSTRAACAQLINNCGIRINGRPIFKPAARVRVGDVLTFAVGNRVRVLQVRAILKRRGSTAVAAGLYEDLSAPACHAPNG